MDTKIERALISVSDKQGIAPFARMLSELGTELLATGGTHRLLASEGLAVREVAEVTEHPEMLDGRVKTLHPRIHGGILARRDVASHAEALERFGIPPVDLVVVNLYPFEQAAAREGMRFEEVIEEIDIGGPAMVRSAAKNHRHVTVVTDPDDYARVLDELREKEGRVGEELRRELARKAFALTARYDAAIARWLLARAAADGAKPAELRELPESFALAGEKVLDLRYGENPHQRAAFYKVPEISRPGARAEPSLAGAEFLGGKAVSYNNLVDLDAALALAKEFERPFVCVVKHNNPCGAAEAETVERALADAWAGDPLSAFGSVLAFNVPLDVPSAEFLTSERRFVEAIVAPSFEPEALEILRTRPKWRKNVRLFACGPVAPEGRDTLAPEVKPLLGGFLVQTRDLEASQPGGVEVVTRARPDEAALAGLLFAERVAKHVKSNAIVLGKGSRVVGIGAGQMSRVDAVKLAVSKAGGEAQGSVLASDAFFPFPDGVEAAIDAGVRALLQPGGSVRDEEVIAACDRRGVAMVFTGKRHFRH